MSKYIFIKYRIKQNDELIFNHLKDVCNLISPEDIRENVTNTVFKNKFSKNSYVAIQNDIKTKSNPYLLLGQLTNDIQDYCNVGDSLPDGSYAMLRFNEKKIELFCDVFGSRTLWYYMDAEKIIVSNSQRAIVSLKNEFKLNMETLSWFLSSGTQGPFFSWDIEIKMVVAHKLICINFEDWKLTIINGEYNFELENLNVNKNNIEEFLINEISQNLSKIANEFDQSKLVLPLSGGYDSRLLFYLTEKNKNLSKIILINWGIKSDGTRFNDKIASQKIADYYHRTLLDKVLPDKIDDFHTLLSKFIHVGDCRIDHFNAFTDNFKLWENINQMEYRIIIRGDIPFTVGLDLNNKMSRSHIGINLITDYANFKDFQLARYKEFQSNPNLLNKKENESLIEWRDRLYVDFRIPIVISSFSDIINGYIENKSPIMAGKLYYAYRKLNNRQRGNKKIITTLSKKLDRSGVAFNATPTIPNQTNIFHNSSGLSFLKKYLKDIEPNEFIDNKLVENLLEKVGNIKPTNKNIESNFSKLKSKVSNILPLYIKGYLKSKTNIYLNPITIAYRIVMVDLALKMYKKDSEFL